MAAFDEQEYTKSFDIQIWKRLLPLLSPYKKAFVGMFVFNGVCALVDVVLPCSSGMPSETSLRRGRSTGSCPTVYATWQ